MRCHTWFYRPITASDLPSDKCVYSYYEFQGRKYTNVNMPHNLILIGIYPEQVLFSLEETLQFIEKNKEKITFPENWEERLIDFWVENPNGVIDFS